MECDCGMDIWLQFHKMQNKVRRLALAMSMRIQCFLTKTILS